MNNIEELKPCPFCGGKAHLLTSNGSFLVECSVCLTDFLNGPVGIGWYRSEKDAAADWNDRPSERALIAQLEETQKERDELNGILNIERGGSAFASKRTAHIDAMRDKWQARAKKAEAALSAANEKPKPISFDELADRVQFVTGGIRMSFDPLSCKGHQIVPFMNFNSLSRIVEMYRTAQKTPVVRQQHADWSNATFGNVGPVGPLKHLSKEALETAASPGDLSEWADMQFLFWDAQRRAGITDAQIEQAMIDKLEINKSRVWPEPKDGEPREHIKAGFTVEGE